jgi:hypothetical protein
MARASKERGSADLRLEAIVGVNESGKKSSTISGRSIVYASTSTSPSIGHVAFHVTFPADTPLDALSLS